MNANLILQNQLTKNQTEICKIILKLCLLFLKILNLSVK